MNDDAPEAVLPSESPPVKPSGSDQPVAALTERESAQLDEIRKQGYSMPSETDFLYSLRARGIDLNNPPEPEPGLLSRAMTALTPSKESLSAAGDTARQIGEVYPLVETAMHYGSAAGAGIVGMGVGATGLLAKALPGTDVPLEDIANAMGQTQEALTYQPRFEDSQKLTETAGMPLRYAAENLQEAGQATTRAVKNQLDVSPEVTSQFDLPAVSEDTKERIAAFAGGAVENTGKVLAYEAGFKLGKPVVGAFKKPGFDAAPQPVPGVNQEAHADFTAFHDAILANGEAEMRNAQSRAAAAGAAVKPAPAPEVPPQEAPAVPEQAAAPESPFAAPEDITAPYGGEDGLKKQGGLSDEHIEQLLQHDPHEVNAAQSPETRELTELTGKALFVNRDAVERLPDTLTPEQARGALQSILRGEEPQLPEEHTHPYDLIRQQAAELEQHGLPDNAQAHPEPAGTPAVGVHEAPGARDVPAAQDTTRAEADQRAATEAPRTGEPAGGSADAHQQEVPAGGAPREQVTAEAGERPGRAKPAEQTSTAEKGVEPSEAWQAPATGRTEDDVRAEIDAEHGPEARTALEGKGDLNIVKDYQDLPDHLQDFAREEGGVRSVFDPGDAKQMWLIANRMQKGEGAQLFRHELGHKIFDELGPEGYDKLLRDTALRFKAGNEGIKTAWNFVKQHYSHPEGSDSFLKEVLARVVETKPNDSLTRRIVTIVRTKAYKLGLRTALDDEVIRNMVAEGLRKEKASALREGKMRKRAQAAQRERPLGARREEKQPREVAATMAAGEPDEIQRSAGRGPQEVPATPGAQQVPGRGELRGGPQRLAESYRTNTGNDLKGLPTRVAVPGFGSADFHAFRPAQDAAHEYMKSAGLPYDPPADYIKADPATGAKIADAYAAMKHEPKDPAVLAAYGKMIDETAAQYRAILKTGLKAEFIDFAKDGDPYESTGPRGAVIDTVNNNHMWVFSTRDGFGSDQAFDPSDNPLLRETEFKDANGKPMLANDVFRVVHDYFGHAKEGNGFRADGEENAWRSHSAMYSPEARKAMTSETRGQNSWLNWGPHGEKNRSAKTADTTFADQKSGILPDWVVNGERPLAAKRTSQQDIERGLRPYTEHLTADEQDRIKTRTSLATFKRILESLPSSNEMAAVAKAGSVKRGWYEESMRGINDVFGVDAPRFTSLLAAFSPRTSVENNIINALKIWNAWDRAGRPTDEAAIRRIMGENVQGKRGEESVLKAWFGNGVKALTTTDPERDMLSGPKAESFRRNLRSDPYEVTHDAWMGSYFKIKQGAFKGGEEKGSSQALKSAGYIAANVRTRQTALKLTRITGEKWSPAEVQETVWSWAKALYETAKSLNMDPVRVLRENLLSDDTIRGVPDFATLLKERYRDLLTPEQQARLPAEERGQGAGEARQGFGRKAVAPSEEERPLLESAARRLGRVRAERAEESRAKRDAESGQRPLGARREGDAARADALDRFGYRPVREAEGQDGGGRPYERGRGRAVGTTGIRSKATFAPTPELADALNRAGIATPTLHELPPAGIAHFIDSINAAKAANKFGAAVHVYSPDAYRAMRLFITDDGKTGFALKGNDIVSVFNTPGANRGASFPMSLMAVHEGGRKLDNFDTKLRDIYGGAGFRVASKLPWDDAQAPVGWDKKTFAGYNKGEPDVLLMAYDPARRDLAEPDYAKSYDEAAAAQDRAVEDAKKPQAARRNGEDVDELGQARDEKNLRTFHKKFMGDVADRAREMAAEAEAGGHKYPIGTVFSGKLRSGELGQPWRIVGKAMMEDNRNIPDGMKWKDMRALVRSRPQVPGYYVHSVDGDTKTMMPEYGIARVYRGPGDYGDPQAARRAEPETTGIKNAVTEAAREERGLPEAEQAAARDFGTVWREAKDKSLGYVHDLVNELRTKPRAVTDVEDAALLRRQITLENNYETASKKLVEAGAQRDRAATSEHRAEVARISDQLLDIYNINKAVGTETGRGLNARKMLATHRYKLAQMDASMRAAMGGRELTDNERANVQRMHDAISRADEAVKTREAEVAPAKTPEPAAAAPEPKIVAPTKTSMNVYRARLKSRILDLQRQIDAAQAGGPQAAKTATPEKPVKPWSSDPKVRALQEEQYKLVKEYDEVFRKPQTEEQRLDAAKTSAIWRKVMYEQATAEGKFTRERRAPVEPDAELTRLRAKAADAKLVFERAAEKERIRLRPMHERVMDLWSKLRRFDLLSSPVTLGKLMAAAAQRMAFSPLEETLGAALGKLPGVSAVAARAPSEGGLSVRAESRSLASAITKGMADADQTARTGHSDLDVLFGKKDLQPNHPFLDLFGRLHGALKSPVKRAAFERSLQKRIEFGMRNGVDVTDPLVLAQMQTASYKDALRSVFMQDNRVADIVNSVERGLERPDVSGRVPISGKAAATLVRTFLPIVKVGTNIVGETFQHIFGTLTGSAGVARAVFKGADKLSPEEADLIMRQLKKGSLGAALLAYGYFNAQSVGGYYQREKGQPKHPPFGAIQVAGHNIPSWLLHNPLLETIQVGATIRHVAEAVTHHRGESPHERGLLTGIADALLGLVKETPLLEQSSGLITRGLDPEQASTYWEQMERDLAIPMGLQQAARFFDHDENGNVRPRDPKDFWQAIESGLPGLRQEVPVNQKKAMRQRQQENYVAP